MSQASRVEPFQINEEDIHLNWEWNRPIAAPGRMAIDFEERVDFRRLHKYRLSRAHKALSEADLGAILCFDNNNIRYLTSCVIGEWARDKICRYALFTGTACGCASNASLAATVLSKNSSTPVYRDHDAKHSIKRNGHKHH